MQRPGPMQFDGSGHRNRGRRGRVRRKNLPNRQSRLSILHLWRPHQSLFYLWRELLGLFFGQDVRLVFHRRKWMRSLLSRGRKLQGSRWRQHRRRNRWSPMYPRMQKRPRLSVLHLRYGRKRIVCKVLKLRFLGHFMHHLLFGRKGMFRRLKYIYVRTYFLALLWLSLHVSVPTFWLARPANYYVTNDTCSTTSRHSTKSIPTNMYWEAPWLILPRKNRCSYERHASFFVFWPDSSLIIERFNPIIIINLGIFTVLLTFFFAPSPVVMTQEK